METVLANSANEIVALMYASDVVVEICIEHYYLLKRIVS